MKGLIKILLSLILMVSLVRCSTLGQGDDSSEADQSEFSESDNSSADSEDLNSDSSENASNSGQEAEVENEMMAQNTDQSANGSDEFSDFENEKTTEEQAVAENNLAEAPPSSSENIATNVTEEIPPPIVETPTTAEETVVAQERPANIKNLKYKANDNGGTLVIEGDQPLVFETRYNPETNQFVVEVQNSRLPAHLKRPLNTKDMTGGIGAIDAYQNSESSVSRIVVQMRPGATEPVVQQEGNSLLVVQGDASLTGGSEMKISSSAAEGTEVEFSDTDNDEKILSSASLEEFMTGNTQFYGKKISLEVSEMDVKEVIKLIAEESGVNIVISDDVKGTVTMKLREVPWDQVLVILMKTKKLGYTRSGSIIRIASMQDIKGEEDDALKLLAAKKAQTPLKVKVIPISYASIKKIEGDISKFLSERGKVVGDERTSSLMITDQDENIERVQKIIKAIDIPPAQVLIEGKIVEATDQFTRQIGVNWNASGQDMKLGSSSSSTRGKTTIGIAPSSSAASAATGAINFSLGTLDVLGDITASLNLYESQSIVKVLSSPRVVALHNEKANIEQSIQIPLFKESKTASGETSRSVEFKDVTLSLNVTPQITNDASVLMDINVSRSFLGAVQDQATQARPINRRSANTKVMVRNAQTAVIGGIYQSDQAMNEAKVPWIGDIPILGWLFKNRTHDNSKNELLIFLTPRILGQPDSQLAPTDIGEVQ